MSAQFRLTKPKNEIVALAVSLPRPVCSEQVLYARCQGKTVNAFIRESDCMPLIDLASVDTSNSDVELFGCYVAK